MTTTHTSAVDPATGSMCGCGGGCSTLERFCRPRFFAGQLLTDDDLRRLDHYVVGKNRLHNRYLHGTGVVCGLEVVCDPCQDSVVVRPGLAIGPCGEDIVVTDDAAVDVAALIRAHRKRAAAADCRPYGTRPDTDCEAQRQRWVLAVCYDESPSRGAISLRAPTSCAACGGHGTAQGGSCGCGTGRPRTSAPQCEPTLTCEGFRFVLLKQPATAPRGDTGSETHPLSSRVQACLRELTSRLQPMPSDPSPAELVAYCCDLKDSIRDLLATSTVHDCLLGARLSAVVCPDVTDEQAPDKARQAIVALLQIAVDLFRSCLCSALLPPCPDDAEDCIPLATLTVRTSDLRVLEVCNWSARRFAGSFPTLHHWFGWLPIIATLRAAVERLCCGTTRPRFTVTDDLRVRETVPAPQRAATAAPRPDRPEQEREKAPLSDLLSQYARATTSLSGLEATVLAGIGGRDESDEPLASDLELAHPFTSLALSRLAGPALAPAVPTALSDALLGVLRPTDKDAAADDDRLSALESTVAELQKTVRSQARTISTLRRQVNES